MDYYVIGIKSGMDNAVTIYPYGRIGSQEEGLLKIGLEEITKFFFDQSAEQTIRGDMTIIEFYDKIPAPGKEIILCDGSFLEDLIGGLKERHVKIQTRDLQDEITYSDHPEKAEYFKLLKRSCQVKGVVGRDLIRVGAECDGGYVMLDDIKESKVAYSFGIGDNISWDEWIADQGIDVYCYDHTIGGLPKEHSRLHFNKVGIAGVDFIEEDLMSMDSILRKNGHDREEGLILKMDVEGAEWGFIEQVSSDILD